MERLRSSLASLCGCALLLLTTPAFAETVKIVVPFAAGGPVDQLARILTPELAAQLKADVIVDDRGGARRRHHPARQHGLANPQPDPQTAGDLRPRKILRAGDDGRDHAVLAGGE